ncbi:MAG: hypothetical protein LBH19_09540 [Dysgonamonadaceae bacterium]|jgi:hypothetical protein|nr:hypothetical protein [Dysgonamonadaceae bacterium]
MDNEISKSSKKDALKEKYLLLKGEYVKLLTDKDSLLEWGKPQLEALYTTKIGNKQLELLKLRLEVKRLKRMTELAMSYLNRNEPINWGEIEAAVDTGLEKDYEKIFTEAMRVEQANQLLSNLASPEHSVELRKLYRQLAKELHPDVNPDLTETQKNLWHAVRRAYEYGDLESLRALSVMAQDVESHADRLSADDFQLQIELLKAGIEKLMAEIEQIRSGFPFNIEKDLKNEEWVKQQNEQTEELIKQATEQKVKYEERLELLKSV